MYEEVEVSHLQQELKAHGSYFKFIFFKLMFYWGQLKYFGKILK